MEHIFCFLKLRNYKKRRRCMTSAKDDYIIRKFVKGEFGEENEEKENIKKEEQTSTCLLLKRLKNCYECGYMLC